MLKNTIFCSLVLFTAFFVASCVFCCLSSTLGPDSCILEEYYPIIVSECRIYNCESSKILQKYLIYAPFRTNFKFSYPHFELSAAKRAQAPSPPFRLGLLFAFPKNQNNPHKCVCVGEEDIKHCQRKASILRPGISQLRGRILVKHVVEVCTNHNFILQFRNQ